MELFFRVPVTLGGQMQMAVWSWAGSHPQQGPLEGGQGTASILLLFLCSNDALCDFPTECSSVHDTFVPFGMFLVSFTFSLQS